MNLDGKRFMTLFLVFCLVALSGNLSAQVKKGVNVDVETNDGQIISGELITVKSDSLLLMDAETQADLSVKIEEVKTILVKNKSRFIELGVAGALLGVAMQGLIQKTESTTTHSVGGDDDENISQTKTSFLEYGAIGLGTGALLGALVGMNKTIQIQGKSEAEIQQDLEKLSKKARVKGIQ
ncbi:hypothetical protein ACFLRX_08275 [Acidobacteriota bacterium]